MNTKLCTVTHTIPFHGWLDTYCARLFTGGRAGMNTTFVKRPRKKHGWTTRPQLCAFLMTSRCAAPIALTPFQLEAQRRAEATASLPRALSLRVEAHRAFPSKYAGVCAISGAQIFPGNTIRMASLDGRKAQAVKIHAHGAAASGHTVLASEVTAAQLVTLIDDGATITVINRMCAAGYGEGASRWTLDGARYHSSITHGGSCKGRKTRGQALRYILSSAARLVRIEL